MAHLYLDEDEPEETSPTFAVDDGRGIVSFIMLLRKALLLVKLSHVIHFVDDTDLVAIEVRLFNFLFFRKNVHHVL
jgi:hypothetical protein